MNQASTSRANAAVDANSQEPDAPLVDAARRRDPKAFKQLITRFGPRIFRLAQKITRNREDAEEVSQDSFYAGFPVHRHISWRLPLLYLAHAHRDQSIAHEAAHTPIARAAFRPTATTEDRPFGAESAADTPTLEQRYSQELRQILASAMGDLQMTFREVLHLRELEEFSTEETARMLELSITAVKSRAHRGRQSLRQALTKYFRPSELADFSGRNSI